MKETERFIHDLLPADFYEKVEKGEYNKNPYPPFADRNAWEKARNTHYAAEIIARADAVEENAVPVLLFSNFSQFNINGDRDEFQKPYYKRRKNLAYLALALCLTGDKEKYMPRLLDHLVAILEEWNWCLPAHIQWKKSGPAQWHFCDLFAAETGMVLALLHSILGQELENVFDELPEVIRRKTLQRTNDLILHSDQQHHWWFHDEHPANWTVWCSSNCLHVAFLLENDPQKRVFAVKKFLEATSRFIAVQAEDGYCAEGPSYYNKAHLMVLQTLLLLEKLLPGSAEKLFTAPKIKKMSEFIANIRMGKTYQATFSDCQALLKPDWSRLLPAGKRLKSQSILDMGALQEDIYGACGDFLGTSLALLFDMPTEIAETVPAGAPVSFFPGRLGIFRTENVSVSLKGGTNAEPHNHNDLGQFSIFCGNTPIIVDGGTGIYSKIHFSDLRYTLWNTRGSGHNAPVFGEYEQLFGEEYTASLEHISGGTFACDLSKAYPAEAGVKKFVRTLTLNGDDVTIEDTFELQNALPATIRLVTPCTPAILDAHTIRIEDMELKLENIEFKETEEMPTLPWRAYYDKDQAISGVYHVWGNPLTGLLLTTGNSNYKLHFKRLKP